MNNPALLIFVKNPVLGEVKTRLAADIGEQKALDVYLELLNHTRKITKALPIEKFVFYAGEVPAEDLFEEPEYKKKQQSGEDLGQRMAAAFEETFKEGYAPVVIIGSDCYELQANHLHEAFLYLNNNDFVIGPAKDGGYYLLGMNAFDKEIFEGIEWSTETVFADTLNYIKKKHKSYHLLQHLRDVDTADDLGELKKMISL